MHCSSSSNEYWDVLTKQICNLRQIQKKVHHTMAARLFISQTGAILYYHWKGKNLRGCVLERVDIIIIMCVYIIFISLMVLSRPSLSSSNFVRCPCPPLLVNALTSVFIGFIALHGCMGVFYARQPLHPGQGLPPNDPAPCPPCSEPISLNGKQKRRAQG